MLKNIKIFIIIGMILTFYLVFPIVLGIIVIKKINSSNSVNELRSWSFITLFFISVIAGVLMLNLREEDFIDKSNVSGDDYSDDPKSNLVKIQNLYNEGIIDFDTYQNKRKKYLEEL